MTKLCNKIAELFKKMSIKIHFKIGINYNKTYNKLV